MKTRNEKVAALPRKMKASRERATGTIQIEKKHASKTGFHIPDKAKYLRIRTNTTPNDRAIQLLKDAYGALRARQNTNGRSNLAALLHPSARRSRLQPRLGVHFKRILNACAQLVTMNPASTTWARETSGPNLSVCVSEASTFFTSGANLQFVDERNHAHRAAYSPACKWGAERKGKIYTLRGSLTPHNMDS